MERLARYVENIVQSESRHNLRECRLEGEIYLDQTHQGMITFAQAGSSGHPCPLVDFG